MMNWEAVGAIGEIVGSIAVIATLVYLATQVRYAKLAASDNSRQNRVQGILDQEHTYLNNPEFRAAWDKAEGLESLEVAKNIASSLGVTVDEARLVSRGAGNWAWLHWAQFRAIKTEEDATELENLVREFYSGLPMRVIWEQHPLIRSYFDTEFVEWVDTLLAQKKALTEKKTRMIPKE